MYFCVNPIYVCIAVINLCLYITDYSDNIEALNISASGVINKLDNFSVNTATVQCVINDGASGDQAEKNFINSHYRCNGRRNFKFTALQVTTTG